MRQNKRGMGMLEYRIKEMRQLAKYDKHYRDLEQKFLCAEARYLNMLDQLSDEQQDLAWEFIFASNALDERLLEISRGGLQLR